MKTQDNRRNVALIGFMGTGKTTVSAWLRDNRGLTEVDTDAMVVEREGMAIKDIFATRGEAGFRDCESAAIAALKDCRGLVISCGGGAVLREENVRSLKESSVIVLLTAKPETILDRVRNSDERPILNGHMDVDFIRSLMEKRKAAYEAAADVKVPTDGRSVEEIAKEICAFAFQG